MGWAVDRGQGLNNALMDSASLVDWLAVVKVKEAVREAVGEYEAEMRERGAKEVRLSVQTALSSSDWSSLMSSPMVKFGLKRQVEAEAVT